MNLLGAHRLVRMFVSMKKDRPTRISPLLSFFPSSHSFLLRVLIFSSLLLLLPRGVVAIPLLDTINGIPNLSTLNSLIRDNSNITNLLSLTTDFTFLAPSNDALNNWRQKEGSSSPSEDVIEELMRYHLLKGRFTTAEFSSEPLVVHSVLADKRWSNVTLGQVVQCVKRNDSSVILSGNGMVSRIVPPENKIVTGGVIQIIDTVLEVPPDLTTAISEFNLNLFAAVLKASNFVNQEDSPIMKTVIRASDLTVFAPNTQKALSDMTALANGLNKQEQIALIGYHVVPQVLYSTDLRDGMKLKTLSGQELTVTIIGEDVYVNSAKIMTEDHLLSNGVLHTIDNLLDAKKPDPPEKPIIVEPPKDAEKPQQIGLSTGAKAGIAVGAVSIALIIATIFVFLRGRRKLREEAEQGQDSKEPFGRVLKHNSDQEIGYGLVNRAELEQPQPGIELEGHSSRNSLTSSQKKWGYQVHPVELEGSRRR